MNQREARASIVREWDRWLQRQAVNPAAATGRESLKFFIELQDTHSPLLEFDPRGKGRDKWLMVHAWLLSAGRVSELPRDTHRTRQYQRMNEARTTQPAEFPSGDGRSALR